MALSYHARPPDLCGRTGNLPSRAGTLCQLSRQRIEWPANLFAWKKVAWRLASFRQIGFVPPDAGAEPDWLRSCRITSAAHWLRLCQRRVRTARRKDRAHVGPILSLYSPVKQPTARPRWLLLSTRSVPNVKPRDSEASPHLLVRRWIKRDGRDEPGHNDAMSHRRRGLAITASPRK
jgi:hypothetical protein